MFDRILIANRGEIARRVIRTARRMGVETVAVYSDADAAAPHAREADAARRIGPAPAAESYLRGEAILEAARATGAQAVHPGYGFLSENAAFAEACAAAGIAFIGPKPHSIRAMGDKAASKRAMRAAGVPLAPGYDGEDQATGLLADEAARIGFPVMIKASAGGGGKGMRIVGAAGEFEAALEGCRREAAGAFGDERVLIEKFIERPRHVEVQVFADAHGSVAHLFDRDCSAQRRHQKVIEEAPAPDVPEAVAAAMRQAAIDAARAVDYLGAGTVEFLLGADGGFYFMEMNTRLQVEHPVTEMVTGLDLVEWQLRVAAGEPLPLGQDEIALRGHAIEARLYAEDPDRDFLPAVGRLAALRFPPEDGAALRIDAGVREGDAVSPFYDPMIAKLISHGPDRETARATLLKALRASLVAGVTTNRGFLARLLATDDFREGRLDTGLIARNAETLARPARALGADGAAERALAAAALWDAPSPGARGDAGAFAAADGWRIGAPAPRRAVYALESGAQALVAATPAPGAPGAAALEIGPADPARPLRFAEGAEIRRIVAHAARRGGSTLELTLDGARETAEIAAAGAERHVALAAGAEADLQLRLVAIDPLDARAAGDEGDGGGLAAPMSGKVARVMVAEGAAVAAGAPLLVIEAMKMEHVVAAPAAGAARLFVGEGDQVEEGQPLAAIDAADAAPGDAG